MTWKFMENIEKPRRSDSSKVVQTKNANCDMAFFEKQGKWVNVDIQEATNVVIVKRWVGKRRISSWLLQLGRTSDKASSWWMLSDVRLPTFFSSACRPIYTHAHSGCFEKNGGVTARMGMNGASHIFAHAHFCCLVNEKRSNAQIFLFCHFCQCIFWLSC